MAGERNSIFDVGADFPMDIRGVGGWMGARMGLEQIVSQRATEAALARKQMIEDAKAALEERKQRLDENKLGETRYEFDQGAPGRAATNEHLLAQAADLRNRPAAAEQAQKDALALAIKQSELRTGEDRVKGDIKSQQDIAEAGRRSYEEQLKREFEEWKTRFEAGSREKGFSYADRPIMTQTAEGTVFRDPKTLQIIPLPEGGSAQLPMPSGTDTKMYGFYKMIESGLGQMRDVEDKLGPKDLAIIASRHVASKSPVGDFVWNAALSDDAKQYLTGMLQVVQATGRKESGAQVRPDEFDTYRTMFARMPTDAPDSLSLRAKRIARAQSGAAGAFQSRAAYSQATGLGRMMTPEDLQALTDRLAGVSAEGGAVPGAAPGGAPGAGQRVIRMEYVNGVLQPVVR